MRCMKNISKGTRGTVQLLLKADLFIILDSEGVPSRITLIYQGGCQDFVKGSSLKDVLSKGNAKAQLSLLI